MSVYKDKKNGRWFVDIGLKHKRLRKKSPDNTKTGAVAYEGLLRQKLSRGEPIEEEKQVEKEKPLFKDFSWEWFELYAKNNNKLSEIRNKRSTLRAHLVPFLGKSRIDEITTLQVEHYKAKKIKEGLKNKTINNHLAILNKCLKTAEEWLGIEKLPKIKKLKVPPQTFDFLLEEDCDLLLKNTGGILHEMIFICLKTGIRFGEVKGLRWEDINWANRIMSIRRSIFRHVVVSPKSNRERQIPMVEEVNDLLFKRRQKEGYVFLNKNGEALKDTNCTRWLHEACARAGIRQVGWHVFRHTFASHLAMAGAPMRAIQELLGHSDVRTTMRYAHLAPSTLMDTVKLLSSKPKSQNLRQYNASKEEKFTKILENITSQGPKVFAKNKQKQDPKAPVIILGKVGQLTDDEFVELRKSSK